MVHQLPSFLVHFYLDVEVAWENAPLKESRIAPRGRRVRDQSRAPGVQSRAPVSSPAPMDPTANPKKQPEGEHSSDYAPYPTLSPEDVEPPPPSSAPAHHATTMPPESNPYVTPAPAASSSKSIPSFFALSVVWHSGDLVLFDLSIP